jgi:uncharacterized RDD family membrane protein YckC
VAARSAAVPKVEASHRRAQRPAAGLVPDRPLQSDLFGPLETPKVVSIRAAVRGAVVKAGEAAPAEAQRQRRTPHARRNPILNQRMLDFLPPAPPRTRTTETNVKAAVCCDFGVASYRYRVLASLLDGCVMAVALAIFGVGFSYGGGVLVLSAHMAPFYIGVGAAIHVFYEALWAIAGGETPGMQLVHLRLFNFDGNRPDRRQRLTWFAASYLSVLAAGAGLIWSLSDEEKLTWHDHIAETFPTVYRRRTTPLHRGPVA